jgi:malate synthase
MTTPDGVQITGDNGERYEEVLTTPALTFLADLHRTFDARRLALLQARDDRYRELAAGATLDFLPGTQEIRDAQWQVAPAAPGLVDRRVEITGPADRKMTINALNSGAKVWLADMEDASTPAWANVVESQLNLRDALDRTIDFTSPEGKSYALGQDLATIVVRPRGWHLPEKHILVDGARMSGSLVDFGLYLFHCAQRQIDAGYGPYFYLPKMESHLEARLWNDVFVRAQEALGIPQGTIRATVLIETIPAAFEMEEILYELREHSSGLNAGRWDYIFSVIKKFRTRGRDFVLPDRSHVTMTVPFMNSYSELLVRSCHKRGAYAIGGMAAFIPSKDPEVNKAAFAKVEEDKAREAAAGFDGSWVAHPGMVELCEAAFTAVLADRPNQLDKLREDVHVTAEQLLDVASAPGDVTEAGLRSNISVGIQYLAAWLNGLGAVAIFNLMEDTATAEISRSQVWQWLHNDIVLADTGEVVTRELVERIVDEEIAKLPGKPDDYAEARATFVDVAIADDFADFLTLPAYERMP